MRLGKRRTSILSRLNRAGPCLGRSHGFSVLELSVAVAIAGISTVAWMSLNKNTLMGQKTILAQDDARTVTLDMTSLLADPAACLKTFSGLNPGNGAAVPAIKNAAGAEQYAVGSVYGTRNLKLSSMAFGGAGADPKTNVQKWASTGPKDGIALLSIEWEQTGTAGNQGVGPERLTRYLLIRAALNASQQVKACVAQNSSKNTVIDGSGAGEASYVPLWISANTLGNSVIAQSGGRIGVGTATPVSALDVAGEIGIGSFAGTTAAPAGGVIVSGDVGIGTAAPGAPLEVAGSVRINGSVNGSATLQPPPAPASVTWTLPNGDGAAAQALTTDGAGVLSWASLCPGQTIGGCVVTAGITGTLSGTCGEGYSGTCSYRCKADKSWSKNSNTCICVGPACTPPLADCPAQTIDNCQLAATPSGGTSGTCVTGAPGACNYSCNDGLWTKNTNTCTPCGGYRYKGGCYYYTQSASSCDTVCAAHGGCDQAATSSIDNASDCSTLQLALIRVPNQTQRFGNGAGRRGGCQFECYVNTSICWYDLGPTNACSDTPAGFYNPSAWRACGCKK